MSASPLPPAPRPRVEAYVRERRLAGLPVSFDLGCGTHKASGTFGVDGVALPGVDLVHDLLRRPYPLPDGCADEVVLSHVLEHFADPMPVLEEVWRIARPGAHVLIRTPHCSGVYAWKDPTHRRAFTSESFDYFGGNGYSYYSEARFRVVAIRLKYFLEEHLWPRPHRLFGRAVQWVLDRHRTFGERFLAGLVGGIDEIQVTLQAVKTPAPERASAR